MPGIDAVLWVFIPTAFVNDINLLIDIEYMRMAIAALTQLILLGITLPSTSRLTQSSHHVADHGHFMDDLSPQMPIYLPKLFALDEHLMPLSTSMSHGLLAIGLRALDVCMPVVLHSMLSNISILHNHNVYA